MILSNLFTIALFSVFTIWIHFGEQQLNWNINFFQSHLFHVPLTLFGEWYHSGIDNLYIFDILSFSFFFFFFFSAETTPLEDVLKFKTEFEAEYGTVHPTFYQGSYSQVHRKFEIFKLFQCWTTFSWQGDLSQQRFALMNYYLKYPSYP